MEKDKQLSFSFLYPLSFALFLPFLPPPRFSISNALTEQDVKYGSEVSRLL
jgi:hypothetical protein